MTTTFAQLGLPEQLVRVLERSGISESLATNARTNAGALIEQLPCDLELRLAAWLHGARSRRALQRLRFTAS